MRIKRNILLLKELFTATQSGETETERAREREHTKAISNWLFQFFYSFFWVHFTWNWKITKKMRLNAHTKGNLLISENCCTIFFCSVSFGLVWLMMVIDMKIRWAEIHLSAAVWEEMNLKCIPIYHSNCNTCVIRFLSVYILQNKYDCELLQLKLWLKFTWHFLCHTDASFILISTENGV